LATDTEEEGGCHQQAYTINTVLSCLFGYIDPMIISSMVTIGAAISPAM
jgi:hypothetical protein